MLIKITITDDHGHSQAWTGESTDNFESWTGYRIDPPLSDKAYTYSEAIQRFIARMGAHNG